MNSRTMPALAALVIVAMAPLGCKRTEPRRGDTKTGDTAKTEGSGKAEGSGSAAAEAAKPAKTGVDLEVTHWWTSGGEAAAVAEFAKAFNATGNHWVDGAIPGS